MSHLRPESEWAKLNPKVLVTIVPDAVALQSLPKESSTGVKLEVDSTITIQELKEKLSRTLQAGLPPQVLVIKGTKGLIPMKGNLTLALYNISNNAQMVFSLK